MMRKLYSYIVRHDNGAAPNPYHSLCTLVICKPQIRQHAKVGHWVLGTGSKQAETEIGIKDFSGHIVYAMKITQVMSMAEYEDYCQEVLPSKILDHNSNAFVRRVGDAIYYDFHRPLPRIRPGNHTSADRERDLSGKNALLSNHFYYFGSKSLLLPKHLNPLVHTTQGCRVIQDEQLIQKFETWISRYDLNHIYADPQDKFLNESPVCTTNSIKVRSQPSKFSHQKCR